MQRRLRDLALADKAKNDFLAMLAHELRNPLAPLRNAVQILKHSEASTDVSNRTRDLIDRQVTNMVRMVDDLLDAARLSRGRVDLHLESLELQKVIGRAVEALRPTIHEHKHRLTLLLPPEPVIVQADPIRLEQVFSNLLNNACKYTDNGGEITLALVVNPVEENSGRREAVIRVRDNGIGIAPDMLPHVFDLFSQADHSVARTHGGLGIGLNIVRSLVELHGGQVSAHSAGLRLGSEFVVRLPTNVDPDARSRPEKPAGEALASTPES